MSKKESDNYLKIVEWSQRDGCSMGTATGLIIGGVRGKLEAEVFEGIRPGLLA